MKGPNRLILAALLALLVAAVACGSPAAPPTAPGPCTAEEVDAYLLAAVPLVNENTAILTMANDDVYSGAITVSAASYSARMTTIRDAFLAIPMPDNCPMLADVRSAESQAMRHIMRAIDLSATGDWDTAQAETLLAMQYGDEVVASLERLAAWLGE